MLFLLESQLLVPRNGVVRVEVVVGDVEAKEGRDGCEGHDRPASHGSFDPFVEEGALGKVVDRASRSRHVDGWGG